VIREEGGRSVIHCDSCPVRLDLGPAAIVKQHLRMPSAWMQDEPGHHLCPTCTQREMGELTAAQA
jgi:hypothetical protein